MLRQIPQLLVHQLRVSTHGTMFRPASRLVRQRYGFDHDHMLQGSEFVAEAISDTFGPHGRKSIVPQRRGPHKITKNGRILANWIVLEDEVQNTAAKLVQDVGNKTNEEVGDGYSRTIVLAHAFAKEYWGAVMARENEIEIREGMMMAVDAVNKKITSISTPVKTPEEITKVATIFSAKDPVLGLLISDAMKKAGNDGVIMVKDGKTNQDGLETIAGMKFHQGYISPEFINTANDARCELNDCLFLISEKKISSVECILPALELTKAAGRPLLIVAEDIDGLALTTLLLNRRKVGLQVCAVRAPFGSVDMHVLHDMAAATGGKVFGDEAGMAKLEDVQLDDLGNVAKVVVTDGDTLLIEGKGDTKEIARRIQQIKDACTRTRSQTAKIQLQERLAMLNNGAVIIRVGGSSEVEFNERKERVINALNATRAAVAEGIVPGGGFALLRCQSVLNSVKTANKGQKRGVDIIKKTLPLPFMIIAKNAGVKGEPIINKVLKQSDSVGYDALHKNIVDMYKKDIIDPAMTWRSALSNASRVDLLTIRFFPKKKKGIIRHLILRVVKFFFYDLGFVLLSEFFRMLGSWVWSKF